MNKDPFEKVYLNLSYDRSICICISMWDNLQK